MRRDEGPPPFAPHLTLCLPSCFTCQQATCAFQGMSLLFLVNKSKSSWFRKRSCRAPAPASPIPEGLQPAGRFPHPQKGLQGIEAWWCLQPPALCHHPLSSPFSHNVPPLQLTVKREEKLNAETQPCLRRSAPCLPLLLLALGHEEQRVGPIIAWKRKAFSLGKGEGGKAVRVGPTNNASLHLLLLSRLRLFPGSHPGANLPRAPHRGRSLSPHLSPIPPTMAGCALSAPTSLPTAAAPQGLEKPAAPRRAQADTDPSRHGQLAPAPPQAHREGDFWPGITPQGCCSTEFPAAAGRIPVSQAVGVGLP